MRTLVCCAFASVAFAYHLAASVVIDRTAVSNADYCEFLNAVARTGDPFGLWNPLLQDHWWGGIVRERADGAESTGAAAAWRYRVKPGYARKPVTCITWESAARYCNWLSFGRPQTGREEVGTTEGNALCGTYDTWTFGTDEFVRSVRPLSRRSDRAYFLPTADEWRAAAFAGGDTGAAIVYDGHWALPFPHLADVDVGVTNRLGHINMLGNVGEWTESRRAGSNLFFALGGSLIRGGYSIRPDFAEGDESNRAISSFGFRVAHADTPETLPVVTEEEKPPVRSDAVTKTCADAWCRVADEGNPRDPIYKVGRVDATYEIARFPVTNADWCEFLNSVGGERAESLGLYNPDMATGVCGGIERRKAGEVSAFACKPGWERRPVVYVGYRDAMRYCNWLQTGDTERGAYDVSRPNSRRLPGARYFIPTDDEWCKAAYYDPTRLGARKYWDYPCRTSDLPPNDPTRPHACNYLKDGVNLGEKAPYYLASVESYPTSDTYYGCRQMAGNVWEWVEPVGTEKLNLRGSSFGYTEFGMGIWNRDEAGLDDELNVFGLRLARAVDNPRVIKGRGWAECVRERLSDLSTRRIAALAFVCFAGCFALGVATGFALGRIRRRT